LRALFDNRLWREAEQAEHLVGRAAHKTPMVALRRQIFTAAAAIERVRRHAEAEDKENGE
jgi:hypothetical protein